MKMPVHLMSCFLILDFRGVNMEDRKKCPFRKRIVNKVSRGNMSTAMVTISEENFLYCIGEQCQAYDMVHKKCKLCRE